MINIIALYIILGIILVIYIILRFSVKISYSYNSENNDYDFSVKWIFWTLYPRKPKPKKVKKQIKPKKPTQEAIIETSPKIENLSIETPKSQKTEEDIDKQIEELQKQIDDTKAEIEDEEPAEVDYKALKAEKKAYKKEQKEQKKKEKLDKKSKRKQKFYDLKKKYYFYKPFIPKSWKAFKKLLKQIRFYDTDMDLTIGKEDCYKSAMLYGKVNGLVFTLLGYLGTAFTLKKPKKININPIFEKNELKFRISGKIYLRLSTILAISICLGVNMLIIYLKQRHKAKKEEKNKKENENKERLKNE